MALKIKHKSVLAVFGNKIPAKNKSWWAQFDQVLMPKDLEKLIGPGNVREASQLLNKLAQFETADGRKISKMVNYHGYDLWWINYDALYHNFCLPYTQYKALLRRFKDFDRVYLFQPPQEHLFRYFLEAHGKKVILLKKFRINYLLPLPLGVLLQIFLSLAFLPLLMLIRPRLMVWIGDKFDLPYDYDFRMKFIYEELRTRKIRFVEFIRSVERWPVVLQHAWQRKRPVIYSAAFIELINFCAPLLGKKSIKVGTYSDPEKRFWLSVAAHGFYNIEASILSIRAMRLILRLIGVRAANISAGCNRTFHELLACKLEGVKTAGILHGAANRYFDVWDFMKGFDGKNTLSVDQYGLWSEWWRDYYLKHSKAYNKHQLFVSGPMRPLTKKEQVKKSSLKHGGRTKVLYIAEEVAEPEELMPYILTLLNEKSLEVHFKFRPYRDNFELRLKSRYPDVYKRIMKETRVFRRTMEEAISQCDVAVGSYSTAVLETLLQLKPFVFFWTDKWGDNFEMKRLAGSFFAETPEQLVLCVKKSGKVKESVLKKLQEQFFGDPHQNGSKWVVDQLIKYA